MIIGVDIDDVIYPWVPVVNEYCLDKWGIDVSGEWDSWSGARELLGEKFDTLFQPPCTVFAYPRRAYFRMTACLRYLMSRGHEVHFVTARPPQGTAVHTADFLEEHFGGYDWGGVHILKKTSQKTKLLKWDVFIDDKSDTIRDILHRTDAFCFAPVRTWNTDLEGYGNRLIRYTDPWMVARTIDWMVR